MKGRKGKAAPAESPALACPEPPSWLPEPAQLEWRRVAPQLFGRQLLADDTLGVLESYCIAWAMVRRCETLLAAGLTIGAGDTAEPHPAVKMQLNAIRECRLLAAELGLTPHRRGTRGKKGTRDAGAPAGLDI